MSLVDGIEIRASEIPGAGNGLFAKRTFESGDVVLQLPRPLVAELYDQYREHSCAWCFLRAPASEMERKRATAFGSRTADITVTACTGCKITRYCSKVCQRKAWKCEHKYECKVLGQEQLNQPARIVLKLLGRLRAGEESIKTIMDYHSKQNDVKIEDPDYHDKLSRAVATAWQHCERAEDLSGGLAMAMTLGFNVMLNSLNLSNTATPSDQVGRGFDPVLCAANHSCDPNAFFVFETPRAVLRAARKIKEGEEVFISYKSDTKPFKYRQAELKEFYFFDCRCPKCEKGTAPDKFNMPSTELSPMWCQRAEELLHIQKRDDVDLSRYWVGSTDADIRMTALQAEVFEKHEHGQEIGDIEDSKTALRICLESKMWPLSREPVPSILRDLQTAYMSKGRIYSAFRIALKLHFVIYTSRGASLPGNLYLLSSFNVMQLAFGVVESSDGARRIKDMEEKFQFRLLPMGLLMQMSEQVPLTVGWSSEMGHRVQHAWRTLLEPLGGVPPEPMKRQIADTWPKMQAYAESIDLLAIVNNTD
ncbi:hypothetical protein LTS10_010108 [Elasticomyces elasticus]|nr:hypothetical protein LTS10_010108 [Elasticomyces elasticus]